jgi:hypothetical protein
MGATGCEPTTAVLTSLLARPDVRSALRELMANGAPIDAQLHAVVRFADPATAANVLHEFQELPRLTVAMILQAWQLADSAGKPFELFSERPTAPVDFARHKRVRIVVDSESDTVRVGLSHIPGRHAVWYAPTG